MLAFGTLKPGHDIGENDANGGWAGTGDNRGISQMHVSGTGGGAKYGNVLIQAAVGDADGERIRFAALRGPLVAGRGSIRPGSRVREYVEMVRAVKGIFLGDRAGKDCWLDQLGSGASGSHQFNSESELSLKLWMAANTSSAPDLRFATFTTGIRASGAVKAPSTQTPCRTERTKTPAAVHFGRVGR